ncbi:putative OsmC-like protein [Desulfobotulus alkaliphilus]|uniref:Putative OsmC-like protein n=1 Tax=Desulfobotulus alkaliphilus TaxID=622671 RepID=A0A562S2Q9_9BACT|nr:OsmC family protein [Desulfobotulus alkaliphilus]TWI75383.1 putative OsmC-like protein [Desulfobotulus alkaliphilus]
MAEIHIRGLGKGEFLLEKEGMAEALCVRSSASAGKDAGFSPTDLVAAALGSCLMAVMEAVLERSGCDPCAFSLDVEKEMAESPSRISRLCVRISPPRSLEAVLVKKLERAMGLCPVKRSLAPDVKIVVVWEHPKDSPPPVEEGRL